MTPDAPPSPSPITPGRPVRIRKRRRRHGTPRFLRDLWLPALILAAGGAILAVRYLSHLKPLGQIGGYIANSEVLDQEYLLYEGKPLHSMASEEQFHEASILAEKGDFKGAALLLEGIAKQCAVPVVFHDIGMLYAQLNDNARALKAFREALARDPNYGPVHQALGSLRGFTAHSADPLTAESEPNSTFLTANLISLGTAVVGDISAPDDLDCFRFSAPAAPRDLLRIEIKSESISLAPKITIYDDSGQPTGEGTESINPGSAVSLLISPRPNATLYVEVAGNAGTSGAYALSVTPTHAFDRYEPNDDINSAFRIPAGRLIEANIMTGDDLDFYSFVAERTGKMVVTLETQSNSLIPGLATFGPDQRPLDYVVEGVETGKHLTRSIKVEEHEMYIVEVSGQSKTTGDYSLIIQ